MMKNHPIAAGLWLVLVVGGIGFGVTKALDRPKPMEPSKQEKLKELFQKAAEVGNSGNFQGALDILALADEVVPGHPSIRLNQAIALRAMGKFDEAGVKLDEVLKKQPKDWDAVAERATLWVQQGKLDEAFELAMKIPLEKGQMRLRLRGDPAWAELEDPRVKPLRKKHGVQVMGDTSVRRIQEMERRRREFEKANPPSKRPD